MQQLLQGLLLGCIIVLPGMSGGTVFLILGIYNRLVSDIARLNLKPYLPLAAGTIGGIFLGGTTFALLLGSYRNLTVAFLLGFLLASIKTVLAGRSYPTPSRVGIMLAGMFLGYVLSGEPVGIVGQRADINPLFLAIGGALSSATMFIPGVPGSSVLVVMGIYDNMLFYLKEFAVFNLAIFAFGGLLGILFLAKMLDRLYERFQTPVAYFFAGLIAGSARVLLPASWTAASFLAFITGFFIVWRWGGGRKGKGAAGTIIEP